LGGLGKIWGAVPPWPQHRTATDFKGNSSHVRKTLTVPRMRVRQMAQVRRAGAQLSQQTR